jgi:hypothetical protein
LLAGEKPMKKLLTILYIPFSVQAFAGFDFESDLKQKFANASDSISLNDFPEMFKDQNLLKCSYYIDGAWHDYGVGFSRYTATLTAPDIDAGRGPLYPGEKGKETTLEGLVWNRDKDFNKMYFNQLVSEAKTIVTDNEVTLTYYTMTYTFRRQGPYIFVKGEWGSTTQMGYCWKEK